MMKAILKTSQPEHRRGVHQNAQRYFQAGRKQKDKSAGAIPALEDTRLELERAKKKQAKGG